RKEVIKCSDAVADANQTDSYTWILDFVLAFPTATGVIGLLAVFSIFLLWQVYLAMYNAVLTIIQSFIALYPGNARTTWLASLFSVLASIILIGAYVFAVTIYVWVMGAVMDIVPAPLARLGSILLGIIIVIAAYNFWKMKKSGKNISQALAEKFAKNGLSKDSTPRKPSNFGSTVKSVVGTGMKMYHRSRMLRAAKAGATVATAVGTAGAGVAAAKAGTTMASHAGTAMASRAGIS